jgi:predicted phage terminase large subunit-like protein
LQELLRRNLLPSKQICEFPEWLWAITPGFTWDWPYLQLIDKHLDRITSGELRRLMLFLPPRHGKSEKVTIRYPVWRLAQDPTLRVIIGAYNQTLAERFSRKARGIAKRAGLRLSEERATAADWETTEGGGIRAVGVGSGVTGHGANAIIIDDPVKSRQEAESRAYRDRVYDWYTDDLYTRLEPNAALILIQTRWHEDDLAGRILASDDGPNWTVISLPAEAEENDPLGREIGEPLCPERYDTDALADRRRVLGSYGYNALYQQRPSPPEGGIIRREWIRHYPVRPERLDVVLQSWDMAFKASDDSSYVVGQLWGRSGANCYLLDQVRAHLDFPATVRAVQEFSERYPAASLKLVEDKANGTAVIATLRDRLNGLVPVKADVSKEARASAVSWLFEAGNVWLPSPQAAPWINDYIDELTSFPNAAHDDQVDATTQALARLTLTKPGHIPTAEALSRS